jgi:hypothetical protein
MAAMEAHATARRRTRSLIKMFPFCFLAPSGPLKFSFGSTPVRVKPKPGWFCV